MELQYKPDFEKARKQWDAFWKGGNKRPALLALLPRQGATPVEKPAYGAGFDGNFSPVIEQVLRWAETHEFIGDAVPFYQISFAADHFSALLKGGDLAFHKDGHGNGWAVPFVKDWDETEITFDPNGKWWERTVAFAQALRAKCDGKLLIGSPDLSANLDALSAIRGAQEFLIDLVERPEAVHRALGQLRRAHKEILDAFAKLLDFKTWGSVTRHGLYSTGRLNVPQCDFSCMISPGMYREFALPYLEYEAEIYDGIEYHLDGPGAIKHLEAICGVGKVGVIQWVAGAGEAQNMDWTWLFKKIDGLGKGRICWTNAREAEQVPKLYKSNALVLFIDAASKSEAEACIDKMERA